MPKTKQRRKPGGKAVPHQGRGKESPLKLRVEERQEAKRVMHATPESLRGLPLFQTKGDREG